MKIHKFAQKLTILAIATLLLAFCTACQKKNIANENSTIFYSIEDLNDASGYSFLTPSDNYTFATAQRTVFEDADSSVDSQFSIEEADFKYNNRTFTIKITRDEAVSDQLTSYTHAGKAGAIEAPDNSFSTLAIYVISDKLYYCNFTYSDNNTLYYIAFIENKTSLDEFNNVFIDYVNHLYSDAKAEKAEETEKIEKSGKTASEQKSEQSESASKTLESKYNDVTLAHLGDSYACEISGGNKPYTWSSADKNIASVDSNGLITGLKVGQTVVTCTDSDNNSIKIIVRVRDDK